jgi:hypothetical protein
LPDKAVPEYQILKPVHVPEKNKAGEAGSAGNAGFRADGPEPARDI